MKHRCPKCGHRWESKAKNQANGGASRWAGMTKAERSAEMKRVRAARSANVGSQRTRPAMPDHQPTEAPTQEQRPGSL